MKMSALLALIAGWHLGMGTFAVIAGLTQGAINGFTCGAILLTSAIFCARNEAKASHD